MKARKHSERGWQWLSPQWFMKGRGQAGESCRERQRIRMGTPHDEGGDCMSITRSQLLFPLPGEIGANTRLWEAFRLAHLAIDAFLKFFSSVILGQCFVISGLGTDATGQLQLLQGSRNGISHNRYVHFWWRCK